MATAGDRARKGWAGWALVFSAIACAVLIAGLLASQAAAFHIPGAGYSGAVNGGGSISFTVSRDGSSVTNLTLTGIHMGDCTLDSKQYTQSTPIINQTFDNGEVSGSFPNVQGAYGHLNVPGFGFPSCRITGTWSATTSASPSGSAECREAQAQIKKRKRALRKAEQKGNQAKIKKLRKRWSQARSRRDQVCG
jgi:hypothetical protein